MQDNEQGRPAQSARASLAIIGFGLFVLAFLVAIDRPHWFQIRPMSGVANALYLAKSDPVTPAVPAPSAATKP